MQANDSSADQRLPLDPGPRHRHGSSHGGGPAMTDRDSRARMGMWVFLASEIMFFGPVFFAYIYGRHAFAQSFDAASRSTDIVCGTANTAILLTSSLFVAAAVAISTKLRDDGERALRWTTGAIDATVALGVLFLVVKGYEYVQDWQDGLVPGPHFHLSGAQDPATAQLFYFIYFFSTLLHAVHLTIGIVLMLYCRRGLKRAPTPGQVRRLEITGLYWHFVDVIWIFLFPALYLAGRAL